MGKDKQEIICFKNLVKPIGGMYVRKKLAQFKNALIVDESQESPDFIIANDGKALAVEHFLIDQTYIEKRSGSRVVNEKMWAMYEKYHDILINGEFDAQDAGKAVEEVIQFALDVAVMFDYDIFMDQFDRVFNNHCKKIPSYRANISNNYDEMDLFFLVELRSLFINDNKVVKCYARRKDGALINVNCNHIIFTERMINKIKTQIGVLKGVILQNYSFFDLGKEIKDMVYLDTSSDEAFEDSLKEQKIQVFKEYAMDVPKINTHINVI